MKIRVQTKGGAFEFDCEPGEPLLYAGLRRGLTLPYECATGTCGTCRARVHEGEARMLWQEAPGLSYVKQEKNEILMCQAAAAAGCTLRVPANVGQETGAIPAPLHRAGTIAKARALTHDVVEFQVAIDTPMSFDAGQFVVLETAAVTGGRAYSMVNFAAATDTLAFVVKRKPEGAFSDWLFETDVDGQPVEVFGPLGRATFDPQEDKNLLCIAGGSGIAGMMSITSRAAQNGYFEDHKGYVFFGVRTADDVFYLDRLSSFAARHPDGLEVTVALSDSKPTAELVNAHPHIHFDTGFVHTVASARMAGRTENLIAYVAGPPPMVDGALRMLVLEARLPGNNIRYDKFG
jgi:toluene monooxygenase electron transfer component